MRTVAAVLAQHRLNLLLVIVPVTWWLAAARPGSAWLFVTAALALVPLAGVIGAATGQLTCRVGPAIGGLLNATFGNAAELIIALVAIHQQRIALVKATITGSIISNLLLVLGMAFFVGGLGRPNQKFHRVGATNTTAMLFLAVVALVMPAVFDLALYGSLGARPDEVQRLSFWSAVVLIIAYAGSVLYSATAHRDLFRVGAHANTPLLSTPASIALLAAATALTTIEAELLVSALQPALAASGLTEFFVGVILVSIVGNAAEHYTAVVAAKRDQMTLAVQIAVGSSAQVALLVAPIAVLYSFAIGRPMTLLFNAFEITAITVSVFATAFVVLDGESNWVEGLQLMAVYAIVALAFYFIPS